MITECRPEGIYLKPENFQDRLYMAQHYLHLISYYGKDDTPGNMELNCSKENVSGDVTLLFDIDYTDTHIFDNIDYIAEHITWLFIGRNAL